MSQIIWKNKLAILIPMKEEVWFKDITWKVCKVDDGILNNKPKTTEEKE